MKDVGTTTYPVAAPLKVMVSASSVSRSSRTDRATCLDAERVSAGMVMVRFWAAV